MKIKNIFITGPIHSGKSTIINQVIDRLPGLIIGGFRTLPLYSKNKKEGFIFESLEGTKNIFAHIDLNKTNQFDIYKFDYTVFEKIGVSTLMKALLNSDVILLDEIGMMEQQATNFVQMIVKCLEAPQVVLGAFQGRATWFLKILRERLDTKIFIINEDNRESTRDQIVKLIKHSGLVSF